MLPQAQRTVMPEAGTPGVPAELGVEDRLAALAEAARQATTDALASEHALQAAGVHSASDLLQITAQWDVADRQALQEAWSALEQARADDTWAKDAKQAPVAAALLRPKRIRQTI